MNSHVRIGIAATWFALLVLSASMAAQDSSTTMADGFKVLHNFSDRDGDGFAPESGLVLDSAGNLYGTTVAGGSGCSRPGCGIIFELTPLEDGSWRETILHSFQQYDGAWSYAPLVFDGNGNLLGTTSRGGSSDSGTLFTLRPTTRGDWQISVLESFTGANGRAPLAAPTLDDRGHLYGTTSGGGDNDQGTIFSASAMRSSSFSVLHWFEGAQDGARSCGAMALDSNGALYGVSWSGGDFKLGTVFRMTRDRISGGWSEVVLHSFRGGSDGASPYAGVILDGAGNVYGTTFFGGAANAGTVFQLSPQVDGSWQETLLHVFSGRDDGARPYGGVVFDDRGNLYGTTNSGGSYGRGTVFELSPSPNGQWVETVLHAFTGHADGRWPGAGVILDRHGNLYGTTPLGGTSNSDESGVVFEIVR